MATFSYESRLFSLKAGGAFALLYKSKGSKDEIPISWPKLELDGKAIDAAPEELELTERRMLNDCIEQVVLKGRFGEKYQLAMKLRLCKKTPFVRLSYAFSSDEPSKLTKHNGEKLIYLAYPGKDESERFEVRLSQYDSRTHSYCLSELKAFEHEDEPMGPILTEQRGDVCFLTAYEHGSMYPDKYVCFAREEGKTLIRAVKGNYWNNQPIDAEPYETIWLQLGAVKGGKDDLAEEYRKFQLSYCSLNSESRKPYIFYNTWAFQERNKFYNKQDYLSSMNQERMEKEIEVAHRMGVDVFVIDTGWYIKTGDWEVNRERFPDGIEHIHKLLEERGMKLGLWFGPCSAAVSSDMLRRHPGGKAALEGEVPGSYGVWGTEDSFQICLASDYWTDFADRLIYIAKTLGVRYFKWDGIDMFGCDRANHFHGGEETTPEDRHECLSFQTVLYLSKTVDRLCEAVPDAIVDMDITEPNRCVGLAFLSSGKYFAINNGPYYQNYDIKIPDFIWSNIFVNPGPARAWICRENLCFDNWIPSVLMMAHYIPDDPKGSQLINLASLMLGQNGIWGDLLNVSDEGVRLFGDVLSVYKTLSEDITSASPVTYGRTGEAFEVREKINPENGRGMVALFANQPGNYSYRMSSGANEKRTAFGGAVVRKADNGVCIDISFDEPGAAIVFFG